MMEAPRKPAATLGASASLLALADAADALARLARAVIEDGPADEGGHLSELEAARLAKVSVRVLRDARRSGDLLMFGKQRSRTVRRADLLRWVESRRAPVVAGPDDRDLERRMRRLSRSGGSRTRGGTP